MKKQKPADLFSQPETKDVMEKPNFSKDQKEAIKRLHEMSKKLKFKPGGSFHQDK